MRLEDDCGRGCEVGRAINIVDFPRPNSRGIRALPQERGSSSQCLHILGGARVKSKLAQS